MIFVAKISIKLIEMQQLKSLVNIYIEFLSILTENFIWYMQLFFPIYVDTMLNAQ